MEEKAYVDLLNRCSKTLIINDGLILANTFLNNRDGVFSLSMISYLGLYCRSSQEFLNIVQKENSVDNKIKDIRNGLKIFTGKYGKSKKVSSELNKMQDLKFRDMLRFNLTKKWNIHSNLGIYFTEDNKVISNTQLASFYIEDEYKQEKLFILGYELGELVVKILVDYLEVELIYLDKFELGKIPTYGYIDYNTNWNRGPFSKSFSKEDNLNLLHILSTIGFVNNYMNRIYIKNNLMQLRIMYITAHNTYLFLKKFLGHIKQNPSIKMDTFEMEKILEEGKALLSSDFRNCMMHYSLLNNEEVVIEPVHFDANIPFFGLIESCFPGENCKSYYSKLHQYLLLLEEFLLSFFTFNYSKIKYDF